MLRLMNGGMPDTMYGSLIILHLRRLTKRLVGRRPQLLALESGMSTACLSLFCSRLRFFYTFPKEEALALLALDHHCFASNQTLVTRVEVCLGHHDGPGG